jgi:hypothetical protein
MDKLEESIKDLEIKEEDENCSICTSNMKKYNSRKLVCGHMFHNKCIEEWFWSINHKTPICPYCRSECFPINKEEIKKIRVYESSGGNINFANIYISKTARCCAETLKKERCVKSGKKNINEVKPGDWYYCNSHQKYSKYKRYNIDEE